MTKSGATGSRHMPPLNEGARRWSLESIDIGVFDGDTVDHIPRESNATCSRPGRNRPPEALNDWGIGFRDGGVSTIAHESMGECRRDERCKLNIGPWPWRP